MLRSAIALICLTTAAQADIVASFVEGAPKDRFTVANAGACALGPMALRIDLSGSAAGLIFDTTARGAGVEVFQPFDVVSGAAQVLSAAPVRDGDTTIDLRLSDLSPAAPVALTIDVDDTLGGREITVSGSEIKGATLSVTLNGKTLQAPFGEDGIARLSTPACTS